MAVYHGAYQGDSPISEIGEAGPLDGEGEQQGETGAVFDEADVAGLASRLLDTKSEAEFDKLLGGVLSHAAQQLSEPLTAPLGRAVGGLLKNLAKQTLPPTGIILGGGAALQRAAMLGLEHEGLEVGEAEFESTKQFIRLAGETVRNALESAPLGYPAHVAEAAITTAAKVYAPSLSFSPALSGPLRRPRRGGRWVRIGRRTIVLGV